MSEYFVTPSPYGEMKLEDDEKSKLLAYPTSKLSAPYDGVVIHELKPPCENYIKIAHNFNDQKVYSLFCGVGTKLVTNQDKVKQGDIIGKFSDDKIEYYVLDEKNKKLSISPFFGETSKPVAKEKEKKEKEKEEKVKKEKEEKNKKESNNDNNKKKKSTGESGMENIFLDMMLLPFSAIHSGTKKITGDSEEDDKKLKEHVNRIKKLLK